MYETIDTGNDAVIAATTTDPTSCTEETRMTIGRKIAALDPKPSDSVVAAEAKRNISAAFDPDPLLALGVKIADQICQLE
jgi:hypothetical protein